MDEKDLQKIIVESINNALNEAILREHIDSIVRECLFEAKTSKKNKSNKNQHLPVVFIIQYNNLLFL